MTNWPFVKPVQRPAKGKPVSFVQECLGLAGFGTAIDGEFGAGTESAVQLFQKKARLTVSGVVDEETWNALVAPLRAVLAPIAAGSRSLNSLTVAYAQQHLKQHPVEIGGENQGPWVRLYMDDNEGAAWPWCAGFATFVVRQAAQTLGVAMPVPRTYSCDVLGERARQNGQLLQPKTAADFARIRPGDLFLVRKSANDWQHVGIVLQPQGDAFLAIEGNTNDEGSREGFEVCQRSRALKNYDYVLLQP